MIKKLIDKQDRAKLGEGRNYGMGFALCSFKDGVITTIQPISPCKDYMNDVLYTEITGKPYRAWGLSTEKKGISLDPGFMAIAICGQGARDPKDYGDIKKDRGALDENYGNMNELIVSLERTFCDGEFTVVHKLDDGFFGVVVPRFWMQYTYLISLYSLLLRMGMYWDGKGEPMAFLDTIQNADRYMWNTAKPKVEYMLKKGAPVQDIQNLTGVHDAGIVNHRFPTK